MNQEKYPVKVDNLLLPLKESHDVRQLSVQTRLTKVFQNIFQIGIAPSTNLYPFQVFTRRQRGEDYFLLSVATTD